MTDEAPDVPEADGDAGLSGGSAELNLASLTPPPPPRDVFRRLLTSPGIASKRWVYRQYDHMVRTNTLLLPGMGAAVVRVKGTSRALAMSVDCNGRFVYLDPFLGAQLAVAEASRNVACAGGLPIGATNCLNFGNPEKPEIMWQFARAVEGMGAACRALDIPITGGNVSLYNETDGRGVLPTPVIGVVGLIEHADRVVGRAFRSEGDIVVLLGETRNEFGGSEFLHVIHDQIRGVPPQLDLPREAALQRVLVEGASSAVIRSAHDCVEGGVAVTLAECCFDTPFGVETSTFPVFLMHRRTIATRAPRFFGVGVARRGVRWAGAVARSARLGCRGRRARQADRSSQAETGSRSRLREELLSTSWSPMSEHIWATAIESWLEQRRAIA